MSTRDLLLEIGTEEIPARFLPPARAALAEAATKALADWKLEAATIEATGTPRRLVLILRAVPERQADYEEVVTGPPWDRAFDANGQPTQAATGFAGKQGIEPGALERIETARGVFAGLRRDVRGRPVVELLGEAIPQWIAGLPFGKNMRWVSDGLRFARPVRWLVARWGADPLWPDSPPRIADVVPGDESRGHRFAGGPFAPADADDYLRRVREQGVMLDPAERRRHIVAEGDAAAGAAGLTVDWDEDLLDEVVDLVEWPGAMLGSFDPAFLELPDCVLEAPMKAHQRYFPLRGSDGRLTDRFLFVANRPDDPKGLVRAGNERVLRARLADARFFWEQDTAQPLAEHATALRRITWQDGLGSLDDLHQRVRGLATVILGQLDGEAETATVARAAKLYLADLGTQMVFEFAEVQGEIGAIYADRDGETAAVVQAIREAHRPKGADDDLPESRAGMALALAHRIDLVVGNLLAGHEVKGNQDPYGMRRAAIGVFRMLEQVGLDADLPAWSELALDAFRDQALELAAKPRLKEDPDTAIRRFWLTRLEGWLGRGGEQPAALRAVLAATGPRPVEARARLAALEHMLADGGRAEAFLDTCKRLRNIARDAAPVDLDAGDFPDREGEFAAAVRSIRDASRERLDAGDPADTLKILGGMVAAADRLFEHVRIQDDDPAVTARRQGLVRAAREVLDEFAAFDILIDGG